MRTALLPILKCPFCGCSLQLQDDSILEVNGDEVLHAILLCQCCAYPVVAGIPYLRTGAAANEAMELLGKGDRERALYHLLGLGPDASDIFQTMLIDPDRTFRKALEVLCTDAEGAYLLHRFSDPTYLTSSAVIDAMGQNEQLWSGYVLDLCGGTGHLTRRLCRFADGRKVILADITFWKLWLAKSFIAPECEPVCCNANEPLPFGKGGFSFTFCSDAFHYIWSKRLAADEMQRLIDRQGVSMLAHVHNALCYNPSAGMPLTPHAYRNLFDSGEVRVFDESKIFEDRLHHRPLDLSGEADDAELMEAPTLTVITTHRSDVFRAYRAADDGLNARWAINPLYKVNGSGDKVSLRLQFPNEYYASEFGTALKYLPAEVQLDHQVFLCIEEGRSHDAIAELAEQRVLLDLPDAYM
ncbi:MAG: methyltransferase domain-containing protein [Pyrinomonadaceae bacterium]